jgi:hypothetical protein
MAMPVVVNAPYCYAYSWKDLSVKVAKILGGTVLSVIGDIEPAWEVAPLPVGQYDSYPTTSLRWFVNKSNVTKQVVTPPVEPPAPESDNAAVGAAFKLLARVLRGE